MAFGTLASCQHIARNERDRGAQRCDLLNPALRPMSERYSVCVHMCWQKPGNVVIVGTRKAAAVPLSVLAVLSEDTLRDSVHYGTCGLRSSGPVCIRT